MYFFLAIITFLKTFSPYLRKHILESLESHEFLFLNTFFVSLFVFLYFIYKFLFHDTFLVDFTDKIKELTILQVIYFTILAFITITSSIVIINLDKYFNTPLINSLFSKSLAGILLLFVSIFIYQEKYNIKQIFGIFLTVVGVFLISCKK
jgi:drug/metabolite transporter (DMT)-like permease